MQIRSFKLRMLESTGHVRVVPKTDDSGCPFQGPGVDILGVAARRVIRDAKPLLDAIVAFEPGVVLRSVSVDLEKPRLLATLSPTTPDVDPRPRVVRIDGGAALSTLLPLAQKVASGLTAEVRAILALRLAPGAEKNEDPCP